MAKKYFYLAEVIDVCGVEEDFVLYLERERLIRAVKRGRMKLYPLSQVDRIRVAHILIGEMGVNLAGVEVALHMRAQIISMQRRLSELIRSFS